MVCEVVGGLLVLVDCCRLRSSRSDLVDCPGPLKSCPPAAAVAEMARKTVMMTM